MKYSQIPLFDGNCQAEQHGAAPLRKPPLPARWTLSDHACRSCFGRVLQRMKGGKAIDVLCAECGNTAPGGPTAICCCGADCGTLGHALECFRNPNISEANPQEIMVRERPADRL